MPKWAETWAGGRRYKDGRKTVFVLEKMRNGRRYTIRLDARNEEEAERELQAFLRDPVNYRALPAEEEGGPLALDERTIQTVLDWQQSEKQSHDHRYATKLYLNAWANWLEGRDINKVSVPELERQLVVWKTARKLRITALKTFCTYYATRKLLTKNPAAGLVVSKRIAAKHTKKRNYTAQEVERAYAASESQVQRDIIHLAVKTGLHISEIERLAQGTGEVVDVEGQGEIAGVVWVTHKSGRKHPASVDKGALAAARRIIARGSIPSRPKRHEFAVRVANKLSEELGEEVRPVQYGALRHTFITMARSAGGRLVKPKNFGVSLEEIAEIVGHTNAKTTDAYDGTEIPPMIVVPLNLTHPSDSEA